MRSNKWLNWTPKHTSLEETFIRCKSEVDPPLRIQKNCKTTIGVMKSNCHSWSNGCKITVFSSILNEKVIFASDETKVRSSTGLVVYRESFLKWMINTGITNEELRKIHMQMRTALGFDCRMNDLIVSKYFKNFEVKNA